MSFLGGSLPTVSLYVCGGERSLFASLFVLLWTWRKEHTQVLRSTAKIQELVWPGQLFAQRKIIPPQIKGNIATQITLYRNMLIKYYNFMVGGRSGPGNPWRYKSYWHKTDRLKSCLEGEVSKERMWKCVVHEV